MANYTGVVTRIVPGREITQIMLTSPEGLEVAAPNNYLFLYLDHPNYASIFSLLMASAVNRLPITIRVSDDDTDNPDTIGDLSRINDVVFDFPG